MPFVRSTMWNATVWQCPPRDCRTQCASGLSGATVSSKIEVSLKMKKVAIGLRIYRALPWPEWTSETVNQGEARNRIGLFDAGRGITFRRDIERDARGNVP